jgi:glycosyltransferase involved in cell wall biosynthesis|tara:strand:+ start:1111 stop:1344 length:234 start_codon:yes stop_codon:yes gene_type:complete
MSNQIKILVFTATYNEKDNIEELIHSITQSFSNADILIIDDNSPYKTIQEIQKKFKNIFLIKRHSKLGLDTAHKKAS